MEDDSDTQSSPILIEEITQPENLTNDEEDIQTLSPTAVIPDTPTQQQEVNSLDSTKSPEKCEQQLDSELNCVYKDERNQPYTHPDSINIAVAIKTTPSPCLTSDMSQMTPTQIYSSPNDEPSNPVYSSVVNEEDELLNLHITPSQKHHNSLPSHSLQGNNLTASQIQGDDDIMEQMDSKKVTFGSKNPLDTSSSATDDTKEDTEELLDIEEQYMIESMTNPVYRITRRVMTIREMFVNRKLVNTGTMMGPNKVSWYSDKHSSSGSFTSGYQADTSSISNSSSGGNMKRSNSNTTSEPSEEFVPNSASFFRAPSSTALRRSNSDNTSSSSKSTNLVDAHPSESSKENVKHKTPSSAERTSVLIHSSGDLILHHNSKVDTPEDFHPQQTIPRSTPLPPLPQDDLPQVSINEAIPVLAKATLDGFYYPGKVFSKDDSVPGKYTVLFEDDQVSRSIRESDILRIDLLPVGQDVFIQAQSDSDDSQVYAEGKVVGYTWKDKEKCYVVKKYEYDTKQFHTDTYYRKQVIVKHEHLSPKFRKMLIKKTNVHETGANVTLDNIMTGKRTRKSVKNSPSTKSTLSPSTTTRSSPTTPPTGRKRPWKSRSDDSTSSSVCMPLKPKRGKRAKLFHEDDSPQLLPENKSLFANCGFLLTASRHQANSSSETEADLESYDRIKIRKMIVAGGGIVAEEFPYLMTCASTLYVISDEHCRTGKYLCALAACVPCLSFKWVVDSCTENKLKVVKSYALAAGHSMTQGCTVERSTVPIQPLSGLKIGVFLEDSETMESILRLAGCHLITLPMNLVSAKGVQLSCEILITDISCPSTVLSRARSLSIPVVSTEWPIQCLINSQQLPFHACPDFKHDYIK